MNPILLLLTALAFCSCQAPISMTPTPVGPTLDPPYYTEPLTRP